MNGKNKNKVLTLVITTVLLSTATIISIPINKACDCGSTKSVNEKQSITWDELITSGAIYDLPGNEGKINLATAYNEISGITLYDLSYVAEMPMGGPWACFVLCMELALGGYITEACITACSLCLSFPNPLNPACIAAALICSVDIGVVLACYITCYVAPCFVAGTQVTMADGSLKNIEDVCLGDKVISFDVTKRTTVSATVTKIYHHTPEEMGDYYLVINNKLKVTPNHPLLMSDYSSKNAGNLKSGDVLLKTSGSNSITSIVKVYEHVPTYNLVIEPHGCYYANGFCTPLKPGLSIPSEVISEQQISQTL
jgi:hypothetical protein